MSPMPTSHPLTSAEAASILGCHVSTISRLVASGDLTPTMRAGGGKGGSMFFDRKDVEALKIARAS